MTKLLTSLMLSGSLFATAPAHAAESLGPYAGQQTRDIKALSEKEVEDLKAGRGMGFAKAAELNGYPGPLHALELSDALMLSDDQRAKLAERKTAMTAAAGAAGKEVLALEQALDDLFATGTPTPDTVADLAIRIGAAEGRLRTIHLNTHIETAAVLTDEQRHAYDLLRGYGEAATDGGKSSHGHQH